MKKSKVIDHSNTRRLGRDFVPSTREELDGYARRAEKREQDRKREKLLSLKQQGLMK
jgi:hypothetical protein